MSNVTINNKTRTVTIATRGVQGPQGPEGPVGPAGPKGDTGDVTPAAITARDAAQSAATTASTKALEAATSAGQASGFADAAELAKDAAQLSAGIYIDTAAGLAATTTGQYFSVPGADANDYLILYRNNAGSAVEVKRYPSADRVSGLEQWRTEAEPIVDRVAALSNDGAVNLEEAVDVKGGIWRSTDAQGHQYLPHLDGRSVQQAINETYERSNITQGFRADDVWQVEGKGGSVTLRQDARGALYVAGLKGSVQGAVGSQLSGLPRTYTSRDLLHSSVKSLMAGVVSEGLPYIAPPTMLVPNNYGVPDGFINVFTCSQDAGQMLETPYADGGLVHPYLLEMRTPIAGYRYWLGETPHKYASDQQENPIIYGSNDLKTFDLLPDFPQPLDHPPGVGSYNSDDVFTYDPRSGELICLWRQVIGSSRVLRYRATRDGINWGPVVQFSPAAHPSTEILSPAILFDPSANIWRMWTIDSEGVVTHRTAASLTDGWTTVGSHNINASYGILCWHLEVKYMGDKFVMLVNTRGVGASNLYFGVSSDGTNWVMGAPLISPAVDYVYKGTFLPEFAGNNLRMHVAWNTYFHPLPDGMIPTFHCVQTNWVDVTSL